MKRPDAFLVINPHSDKGATGRRLPKILAALRRELNFEHASTSGPLDAERLAREALRAGFRRIVAVGGDGTCHEVVNGFFDGDTPAAPDAALGVVPCGTGGDFRRTFGWSLDLGEAARRIAGTAVRTIDLGRIDCRPSSERPATRRFVNVASLGLSGAVVQEVVGSRRRLPGKLAYALAVVRTLMRHRDWRLRLALDGGALQSFEVTALAIANGCHFGGGIRVAPDALPDDGLLDLTLWSGYRMRDLPLKGASLYSGAHTRFENTRQLRARSVRIESDEEVPLEVDGELLGGLPATLHVEPGALRLLG